MSTKEIRLLKANEIECRVGQTGKSKSGGWCSLLLYKDARCDMKILDETFGMFGWQKSYSVINGGLFCTIKIKDPEGNWIERQDIGTESNTEAKKGEASDAMKRACVNIGIGRELYTAPKIFINLAENEYEVYGDKVKLKGYVTFDVTHIEYDKDRNICALRIVDNNGKERFKMGSVANTPQAAQKQPEQPRNQPQSSEEADFDMNMQAFILPALEQARTEDDVRRVWDDFKVYQKNNAFISAVNNKLKSIRSAA